MERAKSGYTEIWFEAGSGKPVGVFIERKSENATVIDYFFEKLKDGLNL